MARAARNILISLGLSLFLAISAVSAASGQSQSQPPANQQPSQDIPDAPSTVQPPAPKPAPPPQAPPEGSKSTEPAPDAAQQPQQAQPDEGASSSQPNSSQPNSGQPNPDQPTPPPPMPPVQTVRPGTAPRNQINPTQDLYTIFKPVNFVQIPVMVKDPEGRRVDGLLPKDFTVLENGKKQKLTFFSSDPFEISAAVLIDLGMHDVVVQKINQTYTSLVGAFSQYDEVSIYTYSSTVSQMTDFTTNSQRLTAQLNQLKLVRGTNNGPPVLSGPMAMGPTVNGIPVGPDPVPPVNTPPREAHVLNDAILRAAIDLSKRERTRRKVIFVISNGQELGSSATYREVVRLLLAQGIQVKAVAVGSGSVPVLNRLERIRIKGQGYSDILPKYTYATGGGPPIDASSPSAMEDAYAQLASDVRNQYTLGYSPQATTGTSAYRSLEIVVDRKGLKVSAKDGYYPSPSAR